MNIVLPVAMRLILFFFLLPVMATADTEREAAQNFQNGQYAEALELWYKMVSSGKSGAALYYNIGTAESLLGHTPEAIMAYEKALRYKPLRSSIQQALAHERKKIDNSTVVVHPFFLTQWYRGALALLRPGVWAFLGLILIVWGVWDFLMAQRKPSKRIWHSPALRAGLIGAGLLLIGIAGLRYREIYKRGETIVGTSCAFRQAPAAESPLFRTLYPGEKAVIRDRIGDWCRVSLVNLDEGWVRKDCLLPITIE